MAQKSKQQDKPLHLSDAPTTEPPANPEAAPTPPAPQAPAEGDMRTEIREGFANLRTALQPPEPPAAAPPEQLPGGVRTGTPAQAEPDAPRAHIRRDELEGAISALEQSIDRRLGALEAGGMVPGGAPRPESMHLSAWPIGRREFHALAEHIQAQPQFRQIAQGALPILSGQGSVGNQGILIPSLIAPGGSLADAIAAGDVGDLVSPFRRPGLVTEAAPLMGLLDDIPYQGLDGANTYEFNREKSESSLGYLSTKAAGDVVADAGAVITFDSVDGFLVGVTCRVMTTAGGLKTTPKVQSIDTATKVVTFESNITFAIAEDDRIYSTYYGAIGESEQKPHGHFKVEKVTLNLQTVPILYAVTQQQIDAIAILLRLLETRMRLGARLNAEWHFLYGSGTAPQLHGFMTQTGAQAHVWSDGEVNDSKVCAIRRAAGKVRPMGNLQVTMNPDEWNEIVLEKDGEGRYLHNSGNLGPVRIIDEPGRRAIGSIRVRLSDAMLYGDALIANHAFASEMVDQQRSRFAVGWVNDQFGKNERTLLYEDSYEHAILDLKAYCTIEFDEAPAA